MLARIRAGDARETAGGCQGRIAVAAGNIKHTFIGAKIDGLAQGLADDLQRDAHHGIVAGGPGGVLARFQGGEVGAWVFHGALPIFWHAST